MTRIVIAPDGFKGSASAVAAAHALAEGWRAADPAAIIVECPMADGGEGTLAAFEAAVPGARRMPAAVRGPHATAVDASWLLLPGGTGVVELASTSGIELLGADLRPWDADTFGFGQAIAAALDHGVARLVLGIGSSAATDGGVGMLTALGARFTQGSGAPPAPGLRGVCEIAGVDLASLRPLPAGGVVVLCDVTSPLLGPRGAAAVFGPQKGLAAHEIGAADAALARLARMLPADATAPGAGAAGGTGFGLLVWGARLVPGAARVADLIGLPQQIAAADLVLTGEGSYDGQSAAGKAPAHVAALAAEAGVPAVLVAGRIAADADTSGFAAGISLTVLAGSAAESLADPEHWLRVAGHTAAALAVALPPSPSSPPPPPPASSPPPSPPPASSLASPSPLPPSFPPQ